MVFEPLRFTQSAGPENSDNFTELTRFALLGDDVSFGEAPLAALRVPFPPWLPGRNMSMYRNRYFLSGILLILLGAQFRMVDSFVLNEPTTRMLARFSESGPMADQSPMSGFMLSVHPNPTKRVRPPRWIGLAMLAAGTVVTCHALVLPRHIG